MPPYSLLPAAQNGCYLYIYTPIKAEIFTVAAWSKVIACTMSAMSA